MCPHKKNGANVHVCTRYFDSDNKANQILYCVYCVWEKYSDRPRIEIDLKEFPSNDEITWDGEYMDASREHEKRIKKCDLSYPIFVTIDEDDQGKYYDVIDGYHRIIKARKEGRTAITAIVLSDNDLSKCLFYTHRRGYKCILN